MTKELIKQMVISIATSNANVDAENMLKDVIASKMRDMVSKQSFSEATVKFDSDKTTLQNLEAFAGVKLSTARAVINGYPVDIDPDSDQDVIYLQGVDQAATTGLLKSLRAAGFKAKRDGNSITVG